MNIFLLLFVPSLIFARSLKEIHATFLKVLLHSTVPQLFFATVASGDQYISSPLDSHESLAMFVAGMNLIAKYDLLTQRYEVALLLELAKKAYKCNSKSNETSDNNENRATAVIKDHIIKFKESYPSLDETWSNKPNYPYQVNVLTVIAVVENDWILSDSELSQIWDFIADHTDDFEVPSCDACEEYIRNVVKRLDEK
jgi:hypothetical protein